MGKYDLPGPKKDWPVFIVAVLLIAQLLQNIINHFTN